MKPAFAKELAKPIESDGRFRDRLHNITFNTYDVAAIDRAIEDLLSDNKYPDIRPFVLNKLAQANSKKRTRAELTLFRGNLLWFLQRTGVKDPLERADIAMAAADNEIAWTEHLCDPAHMTDDVFAHVGELDSHGISNIEGLLTGPELSEIAAHFSEVSSVPCTDGSETNDFNFRDVIASPHLLRVALSPKLLGIATQYLGAPATLAGLMVRRTEPSWRAPSDYAGFHRDYHGFRSCGVYIYLSDVGHGDGPHVFVKNSHSHAHVMSRLGKRFHSQAKYQELFYPSYVDHALVDEVFSKDIEAITGPGGTAFAEDLFGIHRVTMPSHGPRLVCRATYTLTPFPKHVLGMSESGLKGQIPRDISDTPMIRHALRFALRERSSH